MKVIDIIKIFVPSNKKDKVVVIDKYGNVELLPNDSDTRIYIDTLIFNIDGVLNKVKTIDRFKGNLKIKLKNGNEVNIKVPDKYNKTSLQKLIKEAINNTEITNIEIEPNN